MIVVFVRIGGGKLWTSSHWIKWSWTLKLAWKKDCLETCQVREASDELSNFLQIFILHAEIN